MRGSVKFSLCCLTRRHLFELGQDIALSSIYYGWADTLCLGVAREIQQVGQGGILG
jgi:hypothetical protein